MSNNFYFSRLDHLRFFAASLVVYFHFRGSSTGEVYHWFINPSHTLNLWINNGFTGVSLFLVLSGFLFCVISDAGKKEINYWLFIKNRILRIFPLLTVVFFIIICISRETSTPLDILRLLTLQFNTGSKDFGWGEDYYPVGVIWTIAVEFQFYLIFPFLIVFMNKQGKKYLASLIMLFILIRYGMYIMKGGSIHYNLYSSIIGRIDQLLIGMIAGSAYIKGFGKSFPTIIKFIAPFAFIILITLYMGIDKSKQFLAIAGFPVEGALWCGFIYSYILMPINIPSGIDYTFAKLGMVSYSMYLLHQPIGWPVVISGILGDLNSHRVMAVTFVILPVIVAVSFLSFYTIERPFLMMKVKYFKNNG